MCGVTYIKKSESKQLHVRDTYEKLGPIAFQGSYGLEVFEGKGEIYDKLFQTVLKGDLVVTCFQSANETKMKKYLLKPLRRAKKQAFLMRGGIKNCW